MYFSFKDDKAQVKLVTGRAQQLLLSMWLLFAILVCHLFYLQVIRHEHFELLSRQNQVRTLPMQPIRGLIMSSDGVVLAENRAVATLELVLDKIADLDVTIESLRKIISITDKDLKRFRERLVKGRGFDSIPLRFDLSEQEVARFSVNRHLYAGVSVVSQLLRRYPRGEEFAHIVGYVGRIDEDDMKSLDEEQYKGMSHIGKLGVEQAYEEVLHGVSGVQQVEVNAEGRLLGVLERSLPHSGGHLHLFLNAGLQALAVEELGESLGAIVALDPKTGGVLAAVSKPAYDPNLFVNGIDTISYRTLSTSSQSPLLNRVLRGLYSPGSTIKPFLAISALESEMRSGEEVKHCPGWYRLPGSTHRYHDWKHEGHGAMDLAEAVAQSCNVYFYQLAHDLGIEGVVSSLGQFGFGIKTGIDVRGEVNGLLPTPEWKRRSKDEVWHHGETLLLGIGQGYLLVTPLQLARATAILANSGRDVLPKLVARVEGGEFWESLTGSNSVTVNGAPPELIVESREALEQVLVAMHDVVQGNHGTARASGTGAMYEFAGKTGTAQLSRIDRDQDITDIEEIPLELRDHALFIGFAPLDNPSIAIAIIVENGGGGARTAAPIARRLFDYYLERERT